MVLRHGVVLATVGIGLGIIGALMLGDLLRSQLVGVTPSDPLTLVGVGVVMVGVAAAASIVPALRAMWIDPIEALRQE